MKRSLPALFSRQALVRFGPAVALALLIPVLSLLPARLFKDVARPLAPIPAYDKLIHALMYASFAAALFHASTPSARRRFSTLLALLAGAAIYGFIMELAQATLTTSRSMDPFDALANALGAFLALAIACVVARRSRHTQPDHGSQER